VVPVRLLLVVAQFLKAFQGFLLLGIHGQRGPEGLLGVGVILHQQKGVPDAGHGEGVLRLDLQHLLIIGNGVLAVFQGQIGLSQHHIDTGQGLRLAELQGVLETPKGQLGHLVHQPEVARKVKTDAVRILHDVGVFVPVSPVRLVHIPKPVSGPKLVQAVRGEGIAQVLAVDHAPHEPFGHRGILVPHPGGGEDVGVIEGLFVGVGVDHVLDHRLGSDVLAHRHIEERRPGHQRIAVPVVRNKLHGETDHFGALMQHILHVPKGQDVDIAVAENDGVAVDALEHIDAVVIGADVAALVVRVVIKFHGQKGQA